MPKFISDEEMARLEAESKPKGFISDEEMNKMEEANKPSLLSSIGHAATQGPTLGWGDELSAVAEPAIDKFLNLFRSKEESDVLDEMYDNKTYEQRRDEYRKTNEEAKKAHPSVYGITEIATSLPALIGTGGSSGASISAMMGLGAIQGGTMAAGGSDKTGMNLVKDTALGTVGGGLTAGVVPGVIKGTPKVGGWLAKKAENLAGSASARKLGLTGNAIRKMGGQGKALETTEKLLNPSKLIKGTKPAFGVMTGAKKTAENVAGLKKVAGEEMGGLLKQADKGFKNTGEGLVSVDEIENSLRTGIGEIFDKEEQAATQKAVDNVVNSIKSYSESKGGVLTLEELQQVKNKLTPKIKYKSNVPGETVIVDPVKQNVQKRAVETIVELQDKQMAKAAEMGLIDKDAFGKAKQLYGSAAKVLPEVNKASDRAWLKSGALDALSTVGKTAGKVGAGATIGYFTGGKEGAVAGGLAGLMFSKYGNQWMAKGIPAVINGIKDTAMSKYLNNLLVKRGVQAASVALSSKYANDPTFAKHVEESLNQESQPVNNEESEQIKKDVALNQFNQTYAPVLKNAIKRGGGHSFAVTNYLLQQKDENYRKLLNDVYEKENYD